MERCARMDFRLFGLTVYFLLVSCHTVLGQTSSGLILSNVQCSLHMELVEIDSPQYRYFPIVVQLARCRGSVGGIQPNVMRCIALRVEYVNVQVFEFPKPLPLNIRVVNHTQCGEQCVKEAKDCNMHENYDANSCQCLCKFSKEPRPQYCQAPFVWQQSQCGCVCPRITALQQCSVNKEWSQQDCGCRCEQKFFDICAERNQVIDTRSCHCAEQNVTLRNSNSVARAGDCDQVSKRVLAVALISELLIIGVVVLLFYIYCCREGREKEQAKYLIKTLSRKKTKTNGTVKYDQNGKYTEEEVEAIKMKTSYLEEEQSNDSPTVAVDKHDLMEVDGTRKARDCEVSLGSSAPSIHERQPSGSEPEVSDGGWSVSKGTIV